MVGRGQDELAVDRHRERRRTSGRSRSRHRRRSHRTAGAARCDRPGSSRCAAASAHPRGGSSGRATAPSVVAPSSSLPSNSSCSPRQMPRNGRSSASQARSGSVRPRASRRAIAGCGGADTRDDDRVGTAEALRVPDLDRVRADRRERLVDTHQVAGAVVDDGDARAGRHSRTPFVEATPTRRRSISQAMRSERPSALNAASAR